jgi:hypothetical protein
MGLAHGTGGFLMANGHGGARPGAGRKKKDGYERNVFTADQLEDLLQSPHVSYVSRTTISYTKRFKEIAWQRYCDGVDPPRIFLDAGFDPNVLGSIRIKGFFDQLRYWQERGLPFSEGKEPRMDKAEKEFDMPRPPRKLPERQIPYTPEQIAQMYHQIAYMSQELEFIKKIILAGKGGKSK